MKRVLYRLDELVKAPLDERVFIVEGERKADALAALGLTATSACEGAGRWLWNNYGAALEGRPGVVLPDNDSPGKRHAEDIIGDLIGTVSELRCIVLPGLPLKGDVLDWLAGGGSREELLRLVDAAPVLRQPSELFPRGIDTRVLNVAGANR